MKRRFPFLHELCDHLNPGGQVLIGDVAFENRSQLEQCRKGVGDEWDDGEIYFVMDELKKDFPTLAFLGPLLRRYSVAGIMNLHL